MSSTDYGPEGVPKSKQPILIFQFTLPRTKKLVFQDAFRTQDEATKENLSKTSCIRDELITAIESGTTSSVFTAIERYLPHLFGLVVSVEENSKLRLNSPLKFSWSSSFDNKAKPHLFHCYTYRFEVIMVCILFGYAHINKARELMETCGDAVSGSSFDEASKKAVQLLRTAAGIFDYVATRELPRWTDLPKALPLEINAAICNALIDYCCACAQMITMKKGVITGTSNAVLAKLAADVANKCESFYVTFRKLPEYKEDLFTPFKNFLSSLNGLMRATMYKFLGQAEYEKENYGVAVAYLNASKEALKSLSTSTNGTPLARFQREFEEGKADIEHIDRMYTNENNHIYFKPVPDFKSLEVPEAKCLMTPLGWIPPQPGKYLLSIPRLYSRNNLLSMPILFFVYDINK